MIGLVENDLMILDHEQPAQMEAIGWRQMVGQKYMVIDGSKGPVDHRKPFTYIVRHYHLSVRVLSKGYPSRAGVLQYTIVCLWSQVGCDVECHKLHGIWLSQEEH